MKFLVAMLIAVGGWGCGPHGDLGGTGEQGPDTLYPWGAKNTELEARFGGGKVVWVVGTVPDDEFAAASVRGMLAGGRPRPMAYQVFLQRAGAAGQFHRDYVFYNSDLRVLYAVRRGTS